MLSSRKLRADPRKPDHWAEHEVEAGCFVPEYARELHYLEAWAAGKERRSADREAYLYKQVSIALDILEMDEPSSEVPPSMDNKGYEEGTETRFCSYTTSVVNFTLDFLFKVK